MKPPSSLSDFIQTYGLAKSLIAIVLILLGLPALSVLGFTLPFPSSLYPMVDLTFLYYYTSKLSFALLLALSLSRITHLYFGMWLDSLPNFLIKRIRIKKFFPSPQQVWRMTSVARRIQPFLTTGAGVVFFSLLTIGNNIQLIVIFFVILLFLFILPAFGYLTDGYKSEYKALAFALFGLGAAMCAIAFGNMFLLALVGNPVKLTLQNENIEAAIVGRNQEGLFFAKMLTHNTSKKKLSVTFVPFDAIVKIEPLEDE